MFYVALHGMLTEARLYGVQEDVMVINHSVRSTLDNDIHDSRCAVDSCTLCIYKYVHMQCAWVKVQIYSWCNLVA